MKKVKIASYADRLAQKIIESNEPMVNITERFKGKVVCVHNNPEMSKYTGDDIWVRETVAQKLERVADSLSKKFPGYKLKVVFGFRHPEVQEFYFKRRIEILRPNNLHLSEPELEELADTMSANPKAAGHPTGGAIDATIVGPNGEELDMGTGISDFRDPEKVKTFCEYLNPEQKGNRQMLHDVLVEQEFAPYYGEWWHFSYGDREWAFFYDKLNAVYGQIDFRSIA